MKRKRKLEIFFTFWRKFEENWGKNKKKNENRVYGRKKIFWCFFFIFLNAKKFSTKFPTEFPTEASICDRKRKMMMTKGVNDAFYAFRISSKFFSESKNEKFSPNFHQIFTKATPGGRKKFSGGAQKNFIDELKRKRHSRGVWQGGGGRRGGGEGSMVAWASPSHPRQKPLIFACVLHLTLLPDFHEKSWRRYLMQKVAYPTFFWRRRGDLESRWLTGEGREEQSDANLR